MAATAKSKLVRAEPKPTIYNVDEILAKQQIRTLHIYGADHPVLGLTPETFGDFAISQRSATQAAADGDLAKQAVLAVDMIIAVAPSLEEHRPRLMKTDFTILSGMLEFVMQASGFKEILPPTGAETAAPGEAPGPTASP